MGVLMLPPELDCADAVNTCALPTVRDMLLPGLRVILVADGAVPDLVAFPHPLTLHRQRIATANRQAFECDLPMHPSLSVVPASRPDMGRSESSNELENL